MKLLVVVASVRKGRAGKKVADWFVGQAEKDARFEVDLVDLKELDLSYELPEALPSMVQNSEYEEEKDRIWAKHVNDADAVVFVSPEYNHGMPASLKNALDHLASEWKDKPTGFVGYGAAGAPYSQAAFGLVAGWLKLDVVSARVGISEIWAAFNEDGSLNFADYYEHQAKAVLDALSAKVQK
jgi:NAD(P)H-dependent FMN reductase